MFAQTSIEAQKKQSTSNTTRKSNSTDTMAIICIGASIDLVELLKPKNADYKEQPNLT